MSKHYDPVVIQKCASRLYLSARLVILLSSIMGAVVGIVIVYVLNEQRRQNIERAGFKDAGINDLGQLVVVLFVIVCTGVGFWIGSEIALWIKLRAQLALCQMQIEANTSHLASLNIARDCDSKPSSNAGRV